MGLAVVVVMVLPWAIAIGIASHGAFYAKSLGGDFASKVVGDSEGHGAPPGYYTALVSLTFWPGTLLLLPGLAYGIARRNEPAMRYLLCWLVTTWLIFEIAPLAETARFSEISEARCRTRARNTHRTGLCADHGNQRL